VALDIALAISPFENQIVDRASHFRFTPRCSLLTASAEDIVVLKSIAGRTLDWHDVTGILVRQGKNLDWKYIEREMGNLCDLLEDTRPLEELQKLRVST